MTLNHLLSAVRELILNEPAISESSSQRQAEYVKRFPQLDRLEIQDLAAIAPQRLQVYTELIFNGELSMLRWVYPITFSLLSRMKGLGGDALAERKYYFEIVRELHRFRAWESESTRMLAANFQDFVIAGEMKLRQSWLGMLDLIEYEKSAVDVFYAKDVRHQEMPVDKFTTLSVGELLNLPVFVPHYIVMREFQYDVIQLGSHWRDNNMLPDQLPTRGQVWAACGRDQQSLFPRWVTLDTSSYDLLGQLATVTSMTLNDVATVYLKLQAWPADMTEQDQFHHYYAALNTWLSAGVILVSAS